MTVQLGRLIIYTKKIEEMVTFYCRHFGFEDRRLDNDRIVELVAKDGGANILLHPVSAKRKEAQSVVKLVFDVEDVGAFCRASAKAGLDFGPIHQADGYSFANAKDPSGNSVQVSSRAFVHR